MPEDFHGPTPNQMAGELAVSILREIKSAPDKAAPFHDAVEAALISAGFTVRREAYVGMRESRRGFGFIDLLAQKHGGFVAIELDNRSPRSTSMDKLRAFNAYRIVVLRSAQDWPSERDIDCILSIPVAPP